MDEAITKRLHISGLTPALTPADLSKRLSTFGTVKAVDGFGLQDGLGQPRKFGYITLETTQGKLARCLNLLSGSTWKGAKLRIGEAKPDLPERLAAERQAAIDEPPKKKRKRSGGTEAADMTLVTPDNVEGRGGWKVTPLGRVVKSVRMRPDHPLPPPKEDKEKRLAKKGKGKDEEKKKKKKRVKEPDVRARRRTIDVTRWGSVHLKGMFLDMEVLGTKRDEEGGRGLIVDMESEGSGDRSESESEVEVKEAFEKDVEETPPMEVVPVTSTPPLAAIPAPPANLSQSISPLDKNADIAAEKNHSLNLLASLFGNKNDTDWVGRESVGSDVDEAELAKRHQVVIDGDDDGEDFEIVPMDADTADLQSEDEDEAEVADDEVEVPVPPPPPPAQTEKQQQATKLKDLFAPREEDAGFSLLGHLDLDLELDDEIPFATVTTASADLTHETTHVPSFSVPTFSVPTTAPSSYVAPQLNARQALFFPLPPSSTNTKARPKDIFDVAKENGWSWRDPGVGFFRTGTEEEIRKRWEEGKVELTREWKRRCREAGKISRRKRG
ncbi:hypothetical protein FPV67DRAFT_1575346, partial [Lyophyllum atratum]